MYGIQTAAAGLSIQEEYIIVLYDKIYLYGASNRLNTLKLNMYFFLQKHIKHCNIWYIRLSTYTEYIISYNI